MYRTVLYLFVVFFFYPHVAEMQVNNFVLKIESSQKEFISSEAISVKIFGNKNILSLPQSAFILDGARIESLRKLSPEEFRLKILPEDSVNKIFLQIEADAVESTVGKNLVGSNELHFFRKKIAQPNNSESNLNKGENEIKSTNKKEVTIQDPAFTNTKEYISFLKSIQPEMGGDIYTKTINQFYVAKKFISSLRGIPSSLQSAFSENFLFNVVAMRDFITNEIVEDVPTQNINSSLVSKKNQLKNINQQLKLQNNIMLKNYFILGHMGYMSFSENPTISNTPKKFNRADLDSEEISCNKIITFNNNAVYELHENSQNYTFRMKQQSADLVRLLAYRNDAFDFWQYSCFVEEELSDRYFPNGLFCCTDNYCNTRTDVYPIVYKDGNGRTRQVTRLYSTDLLQNNNLVTSGLLSSSPCVNYKRYPNILKSTSNFDRDYYPQGQFGGQI